MNKKEIVGKFLGAAAKQDTATIHKLANADYIQHSLFVPTGLEPFIQLLPVLNELGTYAENVRMLEDGNYVFMHNIWKNAKPFPPVNFPVINKGFFEGSCGARRN